MSKKKLKQKDLAEYVGISTSAISDWKKKNTNPSAENLSAIADFLSVSLKFLLTGEDGIENIQIPDDIKELISYYNTLDEYSKGKVVGKAEALAELAAERAAQEADNTSKQAISSTKLASASLPKPNEVEKHEIIYYPYPASAGTGLFLDETKAKKKYIKPTPEALNADFAIPISGDSMEPYYSSGDIVLIESCPNVPMGKVGIFVLDGEVYIKEYGGDRLISYHEKYPPIMLKAFESAICLGRVLGKAEIIE